MRHLLAHHAERGGDDPNGSLLRYRDGRPLTSRRYDHLFTVQRAIGVMVPRVQDLARVPAVQVRPTGVQGDPQPVTGLDALEQIGWAAPAGAGDARVDAPEVVAAP